MLLGDSQLGNLLSRTAASAPQFLNLAYSREHEEESDRLGIDYMSRAGYNPRASHEVEKRTSSYGRSDVTYVENLLRNISGIKPKISTKLLGSGTVCAAALGPSS